ncbi:PDR/VanB family oxidoreductase [Dactylosporangium sp. CA-092794]|uniref:PDR/VanB family oxidoreductase n=1 Tax=Dactylosporangium sp. CA-092794 TaxID=3239929 RepID=UPI003D8B48D3
MTVATTPAGPAPTVPSSAAPATDADARLTARALLVKQVRAEAADVVSITLTDPDGAELPEWQPGAHLDLTLPSGRIRQYSLCGDPADRRSYTVAVLREVSGRGGSVELHDTALVGRTLDVRGPRNHFELRPAPSYVFLAGGIGITPILAMVRQVAREGGSWRLLYGGRDCRHMAFVDELLALGAAPGQILPQDVHGLLDLAGAVAQAPSDAVVYACGPEGLLRAAEEACERTGHTLCLERFGSQAPKEGSVAQEIGTGEQFEVELRRTGVTLVVPPDRTLLSVVLDVAPSVPYSCEEGYCGTCETKVLEGVADHRDDIFTPEERARGATMMICVGRSKSPRLVLDL